MTNRPSLMLADNLLSLVKEDLYSLSLHDLAELERTTAHITSVIRERVNTYAPVNTLPDELLAVIFEYALPWRNSGSHSRGYQEASHRSDMLARIPLTHVCRRWRSAAVETCTLWTIVDEDLKHLQDVFLVRSANAPIHALARYAVGQPTGVHIAPHAERLNDLFLIYPPASEETGLRTELPIDVPNLECLTVCSSGTVGRDRINMEELDTIFPNGTPSLRRLVLWNMRRLPNVSYERLTHLAIGFGKRLPIIDLLRRCSALENLALIDASVSGLPPSENENNEVQVELPNLRVLTLRTHRNPIAAVYLPKLLPVLFLPSGLTLRLVGSQVTTLLDIHDFDLHRMPIMSTLTAMTIDLRGDGHCTLRASGPSASILLDLPDFRAQRRYGLRWNPSFVPLSAVEVVTYRTEIRNTDLDLLCNCELPSLRLLRFVDAYVPPCDRQERSHHRYPGPHDGAQCEDYIEALSWVLERSPRLVELEIWSANAELPGKLQLPQADVPVRKLTFYYTSGDGEMLEEVDLMHLRNRIPEVVVCTTLVKPEPSTAMPENDALQWEDSGEW